MLLKLGFTALKSWSEYSICLLNILYSMLLRYIFWLEELGPLTFHSWAALLNLFHQKICLLKTFFPLNTFVIMSAAVLLASRQLIITVSLKQILIHPSQGLIKMKAMMVRQFKWTVKSTTIIRVRLQLHTLGAPSYATFSLPHVLISFLFNYIYIWI